MREQLCDVISVLAFAAYSEIIENSKKKREKMEIREFFHEFSSKRMYGLEIIARIVARGIADASCFILRLLHHCGSCTELDVIN